MPIADGTDDKKPQILVFGGTTEGRCVSDYLAGRNILHTVCVATEYGEEVLMPCPERIILKGRMDSDRMCRLLCTGKYLLVVDATHPYAVEVSENIKNACKMEQIPYIRYLRSFSDQLDEADTADTENEIFVDSALEAAVYLEKRKGRIFLTTGSRELHIFTGNISDVSRLFVRVLPSAEAIDECRRLGLDGKQICAMQGPFSAGINAAIIRETGSEFIVTKETGREGGFPEKIEAAKSCGIKAVIIRRPKETGADWEEVKRELDKMTGQGEPSRSGFKCMGHEDDDSKKTGRMQQISCIGIGMGALDTLTIEASGALLRADVVFGSERVLETAHAFYEDKRICGKKSSLPDFVCEYEADKIYSYLRSHQNYCRPAILMSGDTGFYSGARKIAEVFPVGSVKYCCGISSVAFFASRIGTSWDDAKLLSSHGKDIPILNYVKKYKKIIIILGGAGDVENVCRKLCDAGMNQINVTIGTNLSYPDECVLRGTPLDFVTFTGKGLHIMMLENPLAGELITPGIRDSFFVRGNVPMTKEEIRILSVSKLHLKEDSIVYDIGAGTGSVAVECARLCTEGRVFAVERSREAVSLIKENSKKAGVSNLTVSEGTAPEILESLPAPTHAFVGGSSGRMSEIIEELLKKNPSVRIVINTVTMESLAEVTALLQKMNPEDADIVQISVSRSQTAGKYHMMTGLNPVYIISFGG